MFLLHAGGLGIGDWDNHISKMINKLNYFFENENVLMLRKFDFIYPSLYELFNLSFIGTTNKKYVSIALSYSNSVLREINEKFRCIILVDEKEFKELEYPFLNRFEKHYLTIDDLIAKDNDKHLANEIYKRDFYIINYFYSKALVFKFYLLKNIKF